MGGFIFLKNIGAPTFWLLSSENLWNYNVIPFLAWEYAYEIQLSNERAFIIYNLECCHLYGSCMEYFFCSYDSSLVLMDFITVYDTQSSEKISLSSLADDTKTSFILFWILCRFLPKILFFLLTYTGYIRYPHTFHVQLSL